MGTLTDHRFAQSKQVEYYYTTAGSNCGDFLSLVTFTITFLIDHFEWQGLMSSP